MADTATSRPINVHTPLGEGKLLFASMRGSEELGRLFQYDLELLSEDGALKFADLLGQPMAVEVQQQNDKPRFFHGVVTRFSHVESDTKLHRYHATLRPWFWLLTRTTDCRIFQEMSPLDIIKEILREEGFSDFEEAISREYAVREFCVQYRESDFAFISRLMEEEGIYYFFRHEKDKHILVLADALSAHGPVEGYEEILYHPQSATGVIDDDHVQSWFCGGEVQPGKFVLTDYDFENPSTSLLLDAQKAAEHTKAGAEIFDFPGAYVVKTKQAGEQYVKTRTEEAFARWQRSNGTANARGLESGALFKLKGHGRDDQNVEHLVVAAQYDLQQSDYESGSGAPRARFFVSFETLPSSIPFRPARLTPKALVTGPQTAVVVGKAGEEIWTDKFGRVKVKFHWDRRAKGDETSSCWVRVAQLWAGKGWGGIHIPRIGHEVIVEFLEGDPNRPIITGEVYNAEQMPPYGLPGNATQSGIKSHSSKGGGGGDCNELRFEDKAGSEQVFFQAQKDYQQVIKNNRTESVTADRSLSVGGNKTESITKDKTISVTGNHTESITKDKTMSVTGNHTESITGNKNLSVTGTHTESVTGTMTIDVKGGLHETVLLDYTESVLGAMAVSVAGAMQISVVGAMNESVGGSKGVQVLGSSDESVIGSKSIGVKGSFEDSATGARKTTVGKDYTIQVTGKQSITANQDIIVKGKKIAITADDELSITVGKASIILKSSGDIEIVGQDVKVEAKGKLIEKGSPIEAN